MGRWAHALVALGFVLAFGARAQGVPESPLFVPMTAADGLPSSQVNALVQDHDGYLWIATHDGLARYDGVEFKAFRHAVNDPASLPSNSVEFLHVDARNRLWVGTEGAGLSLLEPDGLHFHRYGPEFDPRFRLRDVWAIASGADGVIWAGGYAEGLYRFDTLADTVEVLRADPEGGGMPSNHILSLLPLPDGRLLVATSAGLVFLRDGRFEAAPPFHHPRPGMVLSLLAEPDGSILVGTQAGLERLVDGTFEPAFPGAENEAALAAGVNAMLRDRDGEYWLGTRSGLRHARGGRVHDSRTYAALPSAELVQYMLEDHEGGLWFVLRNTGLLRLRPDWENFAVLSRGAPELGGLSSDVVSGSASDGEGGMWLVHRDGGLERLSAAGRSTRYFETPDGTVPWRQLSAVLAREDGRLWLGHTRGVSLFDPVSSDLTHWLSDAERDAAPVGMVDQLLSDGDGRFWMTAYGGGLQYRDAQGRVLGSWASGAPDGLPDGSIEGLVHDPAGCLWIAGDFGVLRQTGDGRFEAMRGLPPGRIMGLAFSPDGELWTARMGFLERHRVRDGLLERVDQVGEAQGLPAVEVGGVVVDAAGDVWLTTVRGLWRYQVASGSLLGFGVRDGLPSDEFTMRPPRQSAERVIYASTMKGMVVFDPARIGFTQAQSPLIMADVSVLRPQGREALDSTAPIRLAWNDRELTIKARLLSFANPPSNRYRFRLTGFETQWVDVGASGERVFSQLDPGDYRLEVMGDNGSGAWSAAPLQLGLRVSPPWWRSGWAYLGYALALLAALAVALLAHRRRLDREHALQLAQRQREWAERASEAKSSFLATMGHEIRTPMTGVLGMSELLLKSPLDARQRGHVEAIRRSGDLMLRLVNDALDLARIEAGKLELADEAFDLRAMLQQAAGLLRPLADAKGLVFEVRLDADAPRWVRGDGQRMQQIVLNLAGNAIKFTEVGRVDLHLARRADGQAVISVRDTGPGLDAEQQSRLFRRFEQGEGNLTARRHGGSGLGLAICQELAAAMGGGIAVESAPGTGSTFRLQVPLPDALAPPDSAPAAAAPAAARDILVVEDDPVVAQVIVGLLAAQGHRVEHAAHGLAALAALRERRFALVFLDLDLPGLSGFEVARMVGTGEGAPPLVALSARADPQVEERTAQAGMHAFLRKPVRGEDLAEAVRRWAR